MLGRQLAFCAVQCPEHNQQKQSTGVKWASGGMGGMHDGGFACAWGNEGQGGRELAAHARRHAGERGWAKGGGKEGGKEGAQAGRQ